MYIYLFKIIINYKTSWEGIIWCITSKYLDGYYLSFLDVCSTKKIVLNVTNVLAKTLLVASNMIAVIKYSMYWDLRFIDSFLLLSISSGFSETCIKVSLF